MTTSNGRGAREDQCSCFDPAISAHMPESKTTKCDNMYKFKRSQRVNIAASLWIQKWLPKYLNITRLQRWTSEVHHHKWGFGQKLGLTRHQYHFRKQNLTDRKELKK